MRAIRSGELSGQDAALLAVIHRGVVVKRIFSSVHGTLFYFLPARLGHNAMRCQREAIITWCLPLPIRTAIIVKE